MIEIKNLSKRYRNHHGSDWVLRDINLTIPSGVSVGLIGANGAGKSTLLRLIAGMDIPERGEVIRHSRVSWPIGLSGGMQGSMTGRQNVKFVARAHGKGNDVNGIVSFVEDFAEIGAAFDEQVKTYSSGMRSRLSFGLSLAFDFDVYISDEATAVGDRQFKIKARKLFKQKVGSSSLIIVSHDESILRELCQACIYIVNGQAIWFDNIDVGIEQYHSNTSFNSSSKSNLIAKPDRIKNNHRIKSKTIFSEFDHKKKSLQAVSETVNSLRNQKTFDEDALDALERLYTIESIELEELRVDMLGKNKAQIKCLREQLVNMNKSIVSMKNHIKNLKAQNHPSHSSEIIMFESAFAKVIELKKELKHSYERLKEQYT